MTTIYAVVGSGTGALLLAPLLVGGWRRLVDFHDQHTYTSPLPIRPTREPIAALTARPHYEAADELGPWNPSQHQILPAYLSGETAVNTVNSGGAR